MKFISSVFPRLLVGMHVCEFVWVPLREQTNRQEIWEISQPSADGLVGWLGFGPTQMNMFVVIDVAIIWCVAAASRS